VYLIEGINNRSQKIIYISRWLKMVNIDKCLCFFEIVLSCILFELYRNRKKEVTYIVISFHQLHVWMIFFTAFYIIYNSLECREGQNNICWKGFMRQKKTLKIWSKLYQWVCRSFVLWNQSNSREWRTVETPTIECEMLLAIHFRKPFTRN
jgi:hypothetical protein